MTERKLSDVMRIDGDEIKALETPWQRFMEWYLVEFETRHKEGRSTDGIMGYQQWAEENNEPMEIK